MPKSITPWTDAGWVLGDQIEGGNQGHTFIARMQGDPTDQFNYVLKRLKRQNDMKRRQRMHVEAESLRVLNDPSVSRLVATNADAFADPSVELFIVTERIIGPSLEEVRGEFSSPQSACELVHRLLETLKHCHSIPVVHRDIKPCHIIFRKGDLVDPVLIDFGLCFNGELDEAQELTAEDEGVGNRFMILLEQLGGPNKQDVRQDIAQCVGILFYLLTGERPGVIWPTDVESLINDSTLALTSANSMNTKFGDSHVCLILASVATSLEVGNRQKHFRRSSKS